MDRCNSLQLLKEKGLKTTRQRLLVLETIINSSSLFSASSLFESLKSDMDQATIYRILSVFAEHKIIRETAVKNDTRYYELACIHHPVHPHFFCRNCRKLYCLSELAPEDCRKIETYTEHFSAEEISIEITGLCDKCK
jgi:Fe2+ or Zn2+ uptake regulation protein